MSNINNKNKVKCEYYVPMGKPGAIAIEAPVILSILEIYIPLSERINLDKTYLNVETISNKIFFRKPTLNRENKLSINGYINKCIKYFNNNLDKKSEQYMDINIPINSEILINFYHMPIYNNSKSKVNFYQKSKPIKCSFNCVEIIDDKISDIKFNRVIEMSLRLNLTLTQVQNVFIPEPDGNFILSSNNVKSCRCNKNSDNNKLNCVVGYDDNKGLIASYIDSNEEC
ncbi:MAG: hypothetical protein E7208_10100 [Clostridium butyricum]|nr:hypothetical protein [Clostridium butyricum]